MSSKRDRELYGPGWGEVIFGVVLSLLLGGALAAVFLILKPVTAVTEMPKDAPAGMVYYLEGNRNAGRSAAEAKQRQIAQGGSVDLREDELNVLFSGKSAAARPKPAANGKNAEAAAAKSITAGSPNFRIRDGVMQLALPLHVSALGLDEQVIVQARGGFERTGRGVVFSPSEFYVGSCPVQRLPGVSSLLLKRLVAAADVPADLATAWSRVSEATIEGSTLHLTVQ